MRFKILCDLENMIPWEKVINNDPLGTLLEHGDFFFNGRMKGRKGRSKQGSYKEPNSVVLNLI